MRALLLCFPPVLFPPLGHLVLSSIIHHVVSVMSSLPFEDLRRESFLTACMIESSFYCCFLAFNEHSDTSVVYVLSVTMWSVCWVEGVGRGWDQRPRIFSVNGLIFGIGVICKRVPYEITSQ